MSPIDAHHQKHAALLGNPVHNERFCGDRVGKYRTYKNGSIHYHPDTGAWETHGAIRKYWGRMKWENGFLGYPVSDETDCSTFDCAMMICDLGNPYCRDCSEHQIVGRKSLFQGGCIIWWSDRKIQSKYGELMLLLRPCTRMGWMIVCNAPADNPIENLLSFFKPGMGHVRYQAIPRDFGRSIWKPQETTES
ncbi:MAG: hypothetical protein KDL87_16415 [Verrucomicrobiae bacterium]|nr:hypothetical protein [Verrucomicrobiae bacterium]